MMTDVAKSPLLVVSRSNRRRVECVLTQSQLLAKEVYLMDLIGNKSREENKSLKCIMFEVTRKGINQFAMS
jgi:hypothetical protein